MLKQVEYWQSKINFVSLRPVGFTVKGIYCKEECVKVTCCAKGFTEVLEKDASKMR